MNNVIDEKAPTSVNENSKKKMSKNKKITIIILISATVITALAVFLLYPRQKEVQFMNGEIVTSNLIYVKIDFTDPYCYNNELGIQYFPVPYDLLFSESGRERIKYDWLKERYPFYLLPQHIYYSLTNPGLICDLYDIDPLG